MVKTYLTIKLIKKQHKYYKTIKILNLYRYYLITPSTSSMHQNPHTTTKRIPKHNTYPPFSSKQSINIIHILPNPIITTKTERIKHLITYKKKPKIFNKYQHTNKWKPIQINHTHKDYTHTIFSSIHLGNIPKLVFIKHLKSNKNNSQTLNPYPYKNLEPLLKLRPKNKMRQEHKYHPTYNPLSKQDTQPNLKFHPLQKRNPNHIFHPNRTLLDIYTTITPVKHTKSKPITKTHHKPKKIFIHTNNYLPT